MSPWTGIIDKNEELGSLFDCRGLGTVTVPSGVVGQSPTVLLLLFLPRRGIMFTFRKNKKTHSKIYQSIDSINGFVWARSAI